jgi:hypothetical protein
MGSTADVLLWAGIWNSRVFQGWSDQECAPGSKDKDVAGWCAHISNLTTLESVIHESADPGRRKTARNRYNHAANAIFNKCGLWVQIEAVMQDRQCDARSVAKATQLCIVPADGERYCRPHITELAMKIFGHDGFELVAQDVLKERVHSALLLVLQQAWTKQRKDLQSSRTGFDQGLAKVQKSLKGMRAVFFQTSMCLMMIRMLFPCRRRRAHASGETIGRVEQDRPERV